MCGQELSIGYQAGDICVFCTSLHHLPLRSALPISVFILYREHSHAHTQPTSLFFPILSYLHLSSTKLILLHQTFLISVFNREYRGTAFQDSFYACTHVLPESSSLFSDGSEKPLPLLITLGGSRFKINYKYLLEPVWCLSVFVFITQLS